MANFIDYYLETDEDGAPFELSRVVQDEHGLRGEAYRDGRWVDSPRVIRLAMDPQWAERVTEDEVPALMAELDAR
jgi:hypothetical protein